MKFRYLARDPDHVSKKDDWHQVVDLARDSLNARDPWGLHKSVSCNVMRQLHMVPMKCC